MENTYLAKISVNTLPYILSKYFFHFVSTGLWLSPFLLAPYLGFFFLVSCIDIKIPILLICISHCFIKIIFSYLILCVNLPII